MSVHILENSVSGVWDTSRCPFFHPSEKKLFFNENKVISSNEKYVMKINIFFHSIHCPCLEIIHNESKSLPSFLQKLEVWQ